MDERPIRVLVVVSNPDDLKDIGLAPVDVALECQALQSALDELSPAVFAPHFLEPPITPERLKEALHQDYHVLHYLGHGGFSTNEGQAALYLQDEGGNAQRLIDDELVEMLTHQEARPRLIFLAACQSATRSTQDAFLGLGPKLIAAGVPAVVAMQGDVSVEAARKFGATFYRRLAENDGVVDLAANQARATLLVSGRLEVGVPALFMRLRWGRLWEAIDVDGPERIPPQLPEMVEKFTGREQELEWLMEKLRPGQAVTLCGPGGIGKTALASEALWRLEATGDLAARFPDGVITHNFYREPQAEQALQRIAQTYDLEPEPSPAAAAHKALAGRRALLVLDGAESADDLKAVLAVQAKCGVLVTTRNRRDTVGERCDVKPLPQVKAVRLLQAWGQDRAGDQAKAGQICKLVGRLPLAVQLAGSYLDQTGETAAEYLEWLEDSPLATLDYGEHQHESVPVLLDRSLAQVSARAREALSVAGLLALASFDVEAVAAGLDIEPREARRLLGELVGYSLLLRPGERYEVSHALVYTFARERLDVSDEAVGRLAAYYEALAQSESEKGLEGYRRLDAERVHLIRVLAGCKEREAWQAVRGLVWAVQNYLHIQGHWVEWEGTLEAGLAAARAMEDESDEAKILNNLGNVYAKKGEWDRAIEMYQQSLETFERVGDVHGMAQTWGNLGLVYAKKGEWDRAIEMYQQSLDTFERVGDVHGMAATLGNLGSVYLQKGEWDRAIEMYQRDLEISERLGDVHGMAQTFNNLGLVYADKGEWDRAIEMYQRDLEISERVGDVHGMATTWGNLGSVYLQKGDWDRAIEMYQQSLETFERVGDVHGMAQTWGNLGSVYLQKGEWDRAIQMYQQSLETFERVGDVHGMAQTWGNLGLVYARQGEWDRAIEMYQKDLEISERLGDVHGMASTWTNLALVYLQTDRTEEAKPLLARAYRVFSHLGSPHAQTAANALVQACGSVEAANAYLAQLQQSQDDG